MGELARSYGKTVRWWRIVMLSAAVFAIEAAYAVESSYATPALLSTGLEDRYASVMWVFAPMLGILCQGCLGSASDRCACAWGRRRPFILAFAVGACVNWCMFAYGRDLLSDGLFRGRRGVYLVLTAVFFVGMDFCLDQSHSTVRMYLLDSVPPERSDRANYIFSAMIAVGFCFGNLISAIDWKSLETRIVHRRRQQLHPENLDLQIHVVFGIILVVFVVCLLLSLCSVKERAFADKKGAVLHAMATTGNRCGRGSCLSEIFESFRVTIDFLKHASSPMRTLWLMVFLDWVVTISFVIYFTDYVGEVVYGGSPLPDSGELSKLYNEGVRAACWCRMVEDVVQVVYSVVLERISDLDVIGQRTLLVTGHILYFVSLGTTLLYPSLPMLAVMCFTGGIFVAHSSSIPYTLISLYQVKHPLLCVQVGHIWYATM